MKRQLRISILAVVLFVSINLNAQLELTKIFTDNMVLQQNQRVKIWGTAKAKLIDNKAIVSSSAVPVPISIRYAWLAGSVTNLFNAEGLPAIPFFIDDIK